jgi:histidine triad (HIT) family protein
MSLDGAYDDQNIFAKIIRGEIPAAKIYEDARVLAFMDVFPQSRGHCLVVSNVSKARNLLEIEPDVLCGLMQEVQRVAKAVVAALKPEGVVITQFNGAPAGQTVFHLHVHIIPRWADQPLKGHGHGQMADAGELKALAEQIAVQIG